MDYTTGRDNNLNLLRFVAATMVLVSHSFAISTGNASDEPLRGVLGISLGGIAVDVFFAASGFLVTGSLLSRQNLKEFLLARSLRIYPGLWVALVLTCVFVGAFVTTLDAADFFADTQTWKHLVKNAVMVKGADYVLPGAFQNVPWAVAVNGSLWSLPMELRMYLLLAGLWLAAKFLHLDAVRWLSAACVLLAAIGLAYGIYSAWFGPGNKLYAVGAMFFVGGALRVLQTRVPMSGRAMVAITLFLVAAAVVSQQHFAAAYCIAFPYLVLGLAFLPAGLIRRFNAAGDYSYGIYVYAFPVQQTLAYLWVGIGPYEMMAASFGITLVLAAFSWHCVEQPAMRLKARIFSGEVRAIR